MGATYQGDNFGLGEMPNQNVYDVGPGQLNSHMMFGTDSMNTLGTKIEEGMAHEMSEPMGSNGEDID